MAIRTGWERALVACGVMLSGCVADVGDAELGVAREALCPPYTEMVAGGCTPTPTFVGGVELWLRADRGVITARDRRRVTQWQDQSPNDRHAVATVSGTGPAAVVPGLIEPRHAIRFVPSGAWSVATQDTGMLTVDLSPIAGAHGVTVMVVASRESETTNDHVLGAGVGTTGCPAGEGGAFFLGYSDADHATMDTNCRALVAQAWFEPLPRILTGIASPVPLFGDGHLRELYAGPYEHVHVLDPYEPFVTTAPLLDGRIGRGFGSTGTDTRFDGDVHEIVIFDRALEGEPDDLSSELGLATSWLRRHWGL
ncbi:hypothetical protein [Sandaracinus amylolyticus]|nr:hypothetical protein [Sandaracinus amylolyticus]